jgi:transposase-like protein
MPLAETISYHSIDELYLDPQNPRLGRRTAGTAPSQADVLEMMSGWSLEELATSFLQNGFWPQEALIVVEEEDVTNDGEVQVVVEGNRRLAALKHLQQAFQGNPTSRKWQQIVEGVAQPENLFDRIPCILADSREDVVMYLGFRHVTGIKEWHPAEKAEYIAKLIDGGKTYKEVMRSIGSKTETVRRNYISWRIVVQLEDAEEEVAVESIEKRFSVLFLSLREEGIRRYLDIDIQADPESARIPVPPERLDALVRFAEWVFGTDTKQPLFTDSRYVSDFASVLASDEGRRYLETSETPIFEVALQRAHAGESGVIEHLEAANDQIQLALSRVHLFANSEEVEERATLVARATEALLRHFTDVRKNVFGDDD